MVLKEILEECNELINDAVLFSAHRVKVTLRTFSIIAVLVISFINTAIFMLVSWGIALSAIALNLILYVWYFRRLHYVLFVQNYDEIIVEKFEVSRTKGNMKVITAQKF